MPPGRRSKVCEPGLCEIKQSDDYITCFGCNTEFHVKCTGLTDESIKCIKDQNQPGVLWLCTTCNNVYKKAIQLPACKNCLTKTDDDDSLKETVKTQTEEIKKIQENMDKIAKKLENISKLETGFEQSNASLTNVAETLKKYEEKQQSYAEMVANQSKNNGEEMIKNLTSKVINTQFQLSQDRKNRENNIMMFNIKEEEKDRKSQETKDTAVFDDLCQNVLELETPKDVKLIRIGQIKPERTRPVKAIFASSWDKRKFWSKLYNLKDSKYGSITIKHDMNEEDRSANKSLLKQAYEQNQEEKPTNFAYKVRGPPWSQRIVKVFQKN